MCLVIAYDENLEDDIKNDCGGDLMTALLALCKVSVRNLVLTDKHIKIPVPVETGCLNVASIYGSVHCCRLTGVRMSKLGTVSPKVMLR